MLVRQLPPSSRTFRAVGGAEHFTLERELLFNILDAQRVQLWGGSSKSRPPKPIPRPWQSTDRIPDLPARLRDWRRRHHQT